MLAGCKVTVLAVFSHPLSGSEQQEYDAAVSEIAGMKLDLSERKQHPGLVGGAGTIERRFESRKRVMAPTFINTSPRISVC